MCPLLGHLTRSLIVFPQLGFGSWGRCCFLLHAKATSKKRIVNDTLELYCLNNQRQDQLTAQFNDFIKENFLNGKTSQNTPTKQLFKSFLKDYIPLEIYSLLLSTPSDTEGVTRIAFLNRALPIGYLSTTSPPPDVA